MHFNSKTKNHNKQKAVFRGRFLNLKKKILSATVLILVSFLVYQNAFALTSQELWGYRQGEFQAITGLGNADPITIAAALIRVFLGFLGIIAVLMFILAGFKWMLSGGDEDKASEAKKMLISAIVGLIIILASYAIVQFIINTFLTATGG